VTGARLIHLNGPPAVGKSTLARRRAATRLGELVAGDESIVTVPSTDPQTTYRSLRVALGEEA
jgi:hypothetical protein